MRRAPSITITAYTSAPADDQARGLLGWLSIEVHGLFHIEGVTLRRTRDDRLTLAYPIRRDNAGRAHAIVRPLDNEARLAIEAEILAKLRQYEGRAS